MAPVRALIGLPLAIPVGESRFPFFLDAAAGPPWRSRRAAHACSARTHNKTRQDGLSKIGGDLLSGLVAAFALIPEAIALSIIAVVIAVKGGRPGMIPAATGAIVPLMALLMVLLDQGRALATGHRRRARRGRRRARALDIHTVGSMGALPDSLPGFLLAEVPLNLQTLANIFPCADRLAVVGLLESMMTASIVDELTDTPGNENRECVGQVFFASCEALIAAFDFKELVDKVQIDVGGAHFRDITALSARDNVVPELEREGTEVEITGPNEAGATMVDCHAVHDKPGAVERLMH